MPQTTALFVKRHFVRNNQGGDYIYGRPLFLTLHTDKDVEENPEDIAFCGGNVLRFYHSFGCYL